MKQSRIRTTYKISIVEGIFAQVYGTLSTIGSGFIVKLLVMLNATAWQFSLLSAIGQVSQVFQPFAVAINFHLKNRKKNCIWLTFMGRVLTFFLGFGFIFGGSGINFVLVLLLFSAAFQSMGANIWIAWMSDLVPITIRGRFFSRRNQFLLSAGLIAGYLVSFVMDLFEQDRGTLKEALVTSLNMSGYFIKANQATFISMVFVVATALSIFGLWILSKQPDRKPRHEPHPPTLKELYLEPLQDANFRKFLLYGCWWMMAIGIGSAFWSPFMLQKLKMSLFEMQVYGSLHTASTLVSYNFWGKFIDRNGNKSAMKIAIFLSGINPSMWLFMNAQNYRIIWFEALLSGFMWAGAGIVATNFVLSIASKGREQVYAGIYGAVSGVGMMFTTLLSGILYPTSINIMGRHLEPEQIIFGIGAIIRWTAIIPLLFVHEARSVPLRQIFVNTLGSVHPAISQIKARFRRIN